MSEADEGSATKLDQIELVNVVGAGTIEIKINLIRFAKQINSLEFTELPEYPDSVVAELSEMFVKIQFSDGESICILLYESGSYIITGARSEDELFRYQEYFLHLVKTVEEKSNIDCDDFSIRNMIFTSNLDQRLDLHQISTQLENIEYEPEQFSELIYYPSDTDCTVRLYSSGSVVMLGCSNRKSAVETMKVLKDELSN